jgi:hypothetical protein
MVEDTHRFCCHFEVDNWHQRCSFRPGCLYLNADMLLGLLLAGLQAQSEALTEQILALQCRLSPKPAKSQCLQVPETLFNHSLMLCMLCMFFSIDQRAHHEYE